MIPDLTTLQLFVIRALLDGEMSGRQLRECLAAEGAKKSLATFYQLMARLEDGRLVEGWYETKFVAGQTVKERRYKLTGTGVTAIDRAREFCDFISSGKTVGAILLGGLP